MIRIVSEPHLGFRSGGKSADPFDRIPVPDRIIHNARRPDRRAVALRRIDSVGSEDDPARFRHFDMQAQHAPSMAASEVQKVEPPHGESRGILS